MKSICITGYKRPQLFSQLLQSLIANDLNNWQIEIQLEPSEFTNAFEEAAKKFLPLESYNITVNTERLGVRKNPFSLLNRVFQKGASTIVYLEEDIIISADVLKLADWYSQQYTEESLCLSLITAGCGSYGFISYPEQENIFFKSKAFNSLGFVLKRQSWYAHFRHRWLIDYPSSKDYRGKKTTGWDWSIYHYLCRKKDLYCLSPATARATHTGREGGQHCSATWHDLAFDGMTIATGVYPDNCQVVDIKKLPAAVRRHALMWEQMIECMLNLSGKEDLPTVEQAQEFREVLRSSMSHDDFIATLDLKVPITEINSIRHPRFGYAFDLLNKFSIFNTSGKHWTHHQCHNYFEAGNVFYAFRVKDHFFDYGLAGNVLVSGNKIEQFVMDDRVIGLDIELAIIYALEEHMRAQGATQIYGQLVETKDNFPCRDLFAKCGFTKQGELWVKTLAT